MLDTNCKNEGFSILKPLCAGGSYIMAYENLILDLVLDPRKVPRSATTLSFKNILTLDNVKSKNSKFSSTYDLAILYSGCKKQTSIKHP